MNSNLVKNQRFIKQTDILQEKLPDYYFAGVLLSYVVNAAFVGLFLYPTLLKLLGNIAGLSLADTEAVDSVTSGLRAGLEVSCLYSRKGVVSVGIPENFRTSEGGHQHNWPE